MSRPSGCPPGWRSRRSLTTYSPLNTQKSLQFPPHTSPRLSLYPRHTSSSPAFATHPGASLRALTGKSHGEIVGNPGSNFGTTSEFKLFTKPEPFFVEKDSTKSLEKQAFYALWGLLNLAHNMRNPSFAKTWPWEARNRRITRPKETRKPEANRGKEAGAGLVAIAEPVAEKRARRRTTGQCVRSSWGHSSDG